MQALIKKPVHVTVYIVCILFTELQTGQHYSYQREELLLNLLIESPTHTFTTPIIKPNQQGLQQLWGNSARKQDDYATDEQKEREVRICQVSTQLN